MVITGIADEASPDLAGQLDVHEMLGWKSIEVRCIDGVNICELDDECFSRAAEALKARGFSVICFASAIANWARPISTDFARDAADLRRAAPRMRSLGTRFIRVMSYPDDGLPEKVWRAEALRRLRELTRIAEQEGVVLVHENCSGWGGASPENLRALMTEIDSPAFRTVFDTGNPVAYGGTQEAAWSFYQAAKASIVHVHIKDGVRDAKGEAVYSWPGEGWGMVQEVVSDLLKSGYKGAFSIEPHIAGQIHKGTAASASKDARAIYLEYGRRTNTLLGELASAFAG